MYMKGKLMIVGLILGIILILSINLYIVISPIKEAYLKQNTNEVAQNATLSVLEENQTVLNETVQEIKTNEIKEEVIDTKEEIIAEDEKEEQKEEITTSSEATKKNENKETQKNTQTKKNTETKTENKKTETPKTETKEQPKQEETKQEEKKEIQKTIEVESIGEYDIINGGYATYGDWFDAPEGWEY